MVTMDGDRVFLDTNILIRSTVATAPKHYETQAALARLWDSGAELWISRQILREYAAVLTRPQTYMLPVSSNAIASQLQAFLQSFRLADENNEVTSRFIMLLESFSIGGKQIHDANIVATMQAYGIDQLLTNNVEDFTRFTSVIKILPVEIP
jgi:predicted nucleic acid-binding protein